VTINDEKIPLNKYTIMKKYLLVIVALVAFSCGEEHETTFSVQSELDSYVTRFYDEAEAHGVSIPRNLVAEISDKAQSVARCTTLESQNYLYVNPSIADGTLREAYIYKELTALFMKRTVQFSSSTNANRAAEFNEAFQ
jgi:hypothetical protein